MDPSLSITLREESKPLTVQYKCNNKYKSVTRIPFSRLVVFNTIKLGTQEVVMWRYSQKPI